MAQYADQVAANRLFLEFDSLGGFENISPAEVSQLRALVLNVADKIGPHLDRVRITFGQYTEHDLRHLLNIADHIYHFLPRIEHNGRQIVPLNALELTCLWLAILLHDMGMFVSEAVEKQEILNSKEYQEHQCFQRDRLESADEAETEGYAVMAGAIRDAVFAEFIRRNHAERVHGYVDTYLSDSNGSSDLRFRGFDLAKDVGMLCESHNWGVRKSRDSRLPNKCVIKLNSRDHLNNTRVNYVFLACCLRLADVLDFDRTRTPLSAFHAIHFSEPISEEEWKKHLSVKGLSVSEHRIEYVAECDTPDDYVAVQHFLGWVDRELQECTRVVREFPAEDAARYPLNLAPIVDRWQVGMKDRQYVAGAFRFQLDYDQIMRLLMDKSLYPDDTLFLRELLQNALDACRYQMALAEEAGMDDKYIPRIQVWDYSTLAGNEVNPEDGPRIVFQDNGVGMSLEQVENFFMLVGKSVYRSRDFMIERERLEAKGIHLNASSQFGIGFLACFLVGDHIKVETYQYGSDPLEITISGPRKYFLIRQLRKPASQVQFKSPDDLTSDGPPHQSGTRITVCLRENWLKTKDRAVDEYVFQALSTFAANQEIAIRVASADGTECRVIEANRWDRGVPLGPGWNEGFPGITKVRPVPSLFELSKYSEWLRGRAAIWFLDDGGTPVPRRGAVRLNGGVLETTPFVKALRELCSQFAGANGSRHSAVMDCLYQIKSSPSEWRNIVSGFASRLDIQGARFDAREVFGNLVHGDMDIVLDVGRIFPSLFTSQSDWCEDLEELELLYAEDLRGLIEAWTNKGVSEGFGVQLRTQYRLALYGIESPGGFQTWNPARGNASRHDWLVPGLTVDLDARGGLAPQPAANRLFVPYDNGSKLRLAVIRAFVLHAHDLWQSNCHSKDWTEWHSSFVAAWYYGDLDLALGEIDVRTLHAEYVSAHPHAGPDAQPYLRLLAMKHSAFGRWVSERRYAKAWDFSRPLTREQLVWAAEKAGVSEKRIEAELQSLSEYLGLDMAAYPSGSSWFAD